MKTFLTFIVLLFSTSIFAQSYNAQPAFIKDVKKQNGKIVLVLDFVELKYTGDLKDFKIINDNPRLREFTLSKNFKIDNCTEDKSINESNLLQKKNKLIAPRGKKVLVFLTAEGNMAISLNLGCVS